MNKEMLAAVHEVAAAKQIDPEVLLSALEEALRAAYKKTPGSGRHVRVELDRETGDWRVLQVNVDDEILIEKGLLHLPPEPDPDAEPEVEPAPHPHAHFNSRGDSGFRGDGGYRGDGYPLIEEEPEPIIEWDRLAEEDIEVVDVTPDNFGRIAAQTAKQVILQRIREVEREQQFVEYEDRVGDIVTGIVQQTAPSYCLVDLGKVEALLPGSEGVPGERYDHGARIKAVIIDVRRGTKGPQIVLSRRSEELIRELFELEVPEIADGLVVIRAVAREAGYRAKIAVESRVQGVDPVGACVGPRGSRVRMVVSELRGEKIDIIPWNNEPARFIAKALAPARVKEVFVDDDSMQATVIVPDAELSLAIGREGQNARLAARLTGWRIDIKSETEYRIANDEDYEGADTLGGVITGSGLGDRQMRAVLKEGRVTINGIVVRRYDRLVGPDDVVALDGDTVERAAT